MKVTSAIVLAILLLLTGCGGGGTTTTQGSSKEPNGGGSGTQPPVSDARGTYQLWEYFTPTSDKSRSFAYNAPSGSTRYTMHYQVSGTIVTETEDQAAGEKTVYTKKNDRISVTFYKNGQPNGAYDLKLSANIGDTVTTTDSDCKLTKHYDLFTFPGQQKSYDDVIEIDCGNHPGYYQRYAGEIGQDQGGVNGTAQVHIYALN